VTPTPQGPFHTFAHDVVLEPGQHIGFEAGHGYYAAGSGQHGEAKNDTPFNRPVEHSMPHHPDREAQLRAAIVHWAYWGIAHRASFDYTMHSPERLSMYHRAPGDLRGRITADCSGAVSGLYKWADAPDPNRLGYGGDPYTGTLLHAMREISATDAKPADLIVYGGGTGEHVSLILERISAIDFWTFSDGHQGAPDRQQHSGMAQWMAAHGHPGVRFLTSLGAA
jgi:hypothetical protein